MSADEPNELKHMTMDVTFSVIACRTCAGSRVLDMADLGPSAGEPCECGCGWFQILCQMCWLVIGEATTRSTVQLCKLD